jgi:hypothetical protein
MPFRQAVNAAKAAHVAAEEAARLVQLEPIRTAKPLSC